MFGCKEVIVCSDQGPTELIYDNMDYTADKLNEYARSFQYLKIPYGWKKLKRRNGKRMQNTLPSPHIFKINLTYLVKISLK